MNTNIGRQTDRKTDGPSQKVLFCIKKSPLGGDAKKNENKMTANRSASE